MSESLSHSGKMPPDVTEQAHIQETLHHREAQLELALEFAHIGIWDWDLATNAVVWNAKHFCLLGLEPDGSQATYGLWRDRVHPDDLHQVEGFIANALRNRTTYEAEYRIIDPNGTIRWVTAKGRGLYDETGQPSRMMGVLLDISDRKQTEVELRQLNQALEAQNFNLEQAVAQRTAKLLQMNEKLQAEINERQRAETALKESEELFRQVFDNAPIDITERKQAQDDLAKRSAQLEAANRELEFFSYSVSHDLRAPLRHLNGFVSALSHQIASTEAIADPKVQHYLQVIQDSSKKMGLLIDGLLTLSRVGRRQMERRSVDLTNLATQSIRLIRSSLDTPTSVQFVLEKLPIVQGDPTLLQQVFINLIDNAVKFSKGRSPAQVTIGVLPERTLFVKDNGVGFQMEYADQLFGAFQRLHSHQDFEGMGIGLAIVQRIIHRHGGTIWAESQPEQGACFYFTLG